MGRPGPTQIINIPAIIRPHSLYKQTDANSTQASSLPTLAQRI